MNNEFLKSGGIFANIFDQAELNNKPEAYVANKLFAFYKEANKQVVSKMGDVEVLIDQMGPTTKLVSITYDICGRLWLNYQDKTTSIREWTFLEDQDRIEDKDILSITLYPEGGNFMLEFSIDLDTDFAKKYPWEKIKAFKIEKNEYDVVSYILIGCKDLVELSENS